MPRELDISRLNKFEPKKVLAPEADSTESVKTHHVPIKAKETKWPSREAPQEGQFTIRGPLSEIERFRTICKDDRRTYADMLRILMDTHEKNGAGG
jgi:hypothetical protein